MSANQNSALVNDIQIGARFVEEATAADASLGKLASASSSISSFDHATASVLTNGYAPAPFLIERPVRENCPNVDEIFTPNNLASVVESSNRKIVNLLNYDAGITVTPSKRDAFNRICEKIEDIKESFLSARENILSVEHLYAQLKLTSADTRAEIEKNSQLIEQAKELIANLERNLETIAHERKEMRQIELKADLKDGSMFNSILTCSRAVEKFITAVREDIGSDSTGAELGRAREYIAHLVAHNEAFEQQEKKFAEQVEEHRQYTEAHLQAFEGAKSSIEAVGADTMDGLINREMAIQFSDRFSQKTAPGFKSESFVAASSIASDDIRALFAARFPERYAELTNTPMTEQAVNVQAEREIAEPKSDPVAAALVSEQATQPEVTVINQRQDSSEEIIEADPEKISYEEDIASDESDTAIYPDNEGLYARAQEEEIPSAERENEIPKLIDSEVPVSLSAEASTEETSEKVQDSSKENLQELLERLEEERSQNWEKRKASTDSYEISQLGQRNAELGEEIRIIKEQLATKEEATSEVSHDADKKLLQAEAELIRVTAELKEVVRKRDIHSQILWNEHYDAEGDAAAESTLKTVKEFVKLTDDLKARIDDNDKLLEEFNDSDPSKPSVEQLKVAILQTNYLKSVESKISDSRRILEVNFDEPSEVSSAQNASSEFKSEADSASSLAEEKQVDGASEEQSRSAALDKVDTEAYTLDGRTLPRRTITGFRDDLEFKPTINRGTDRKLEDEARIDMDRIHADHIVDEVMRVLPEWDDNRQEHEKLRTEKHEMLKKVSLGNKVLADLQETQPKGFIQKLFSKAFYEQLAGKIEHAKEKIAEYSELACSAIFDESRFLSRFALKVREKLGNKTFVINDDNRDQLPAPLLHAAIPVKFKDRTPTFDGLQDRAEQIAKQFGADFARDIRTPEGSPGCVLELVNDKGQYLGQIQIGEARYGRAHLFIDRNDGRGAQYKGDIWSAQVETAIKAFLRNNESAFEKRSSVLNGEYFIPTLGSEALARQSRFAKDGLRDF